QLLAFRADERQKAFDRRRGIGDARGIADDRIERLGEAALAVVDLEHGLPGDEIDRALERAGERAVDERDGDDHRDAEHDAEKREQRAQPVALHMAPAHETEEPEHQRRSSSSRPSRKWITRSVRAAASRSCVTITTVEPASRLIVRIVSRIAAPFFES